MERKRERKGNGTMDPRTWSVKVTYARGQLEALGSLVVGRAEADKRDPPEMGNGLRVTWDA